MFRDEHLPAGTPAGRPDMPSGAARLLAVILAACLLTGASPALSQEETGAAEPAAKPDPWAPFRLLEGTWEGTIEGRLGQGRGRRRYEFLFDGLYLVQRHASVRLPQEKSPQGDYHRELGVYSFDRERGVIVLRTFMVEGYVVRYACETEPKRFVCTSESVESGSGVRARLTVEVQDRYRFEETYELAFPGQELTTYFTNRWTRASDLAD
jgi:hypothetical protein